VGNSSDTARSPAQLLMHHAQISVIDFLDATGATQLIRRCRIAPTTHGARGAEEDAPVAALAGASAITIDSHSWPYHGMSAAEVFAGAAI